MKPKALKLFLFAVLLLLNVTSCKNFLNGKAILNDLNETIDFINLPYVEVTITSDKAATNQILPAANIYSNDYKKGQSIELSIFIEKDYNFSCWQCIPEGSVHFESETATKTKATIVSDDTKITIKANTYKTPSVNLNIACNPLEGELNFTGAKEYKQGEELKLTFIPNGKYKVKKWDIFNEDNIPIPDSIISTSLFNNNTEITMKIKNGYEGTINVRPYCALIPEVKNFLPDTKNGAVPQDSNIVITFNKPMNKENFKFSENISIMLNGLNKTDYFSEPELSEDGTILTIPTNKEKSFLDSEDPNNLVLIVSLSNIYEATTYENEIPQKMEAVSFSYVIKAERDSIAPKITGLKLYKDPDHKKELINTDYNDWEAESYKTNHVKDCYLSIEGTDNGGGVYRINVKETLLKDTNNNNITYPAKTKNIGENKFIFEENKYSASLGFSFDTVSDGLLKIELSLEDYAGNISEIKTYYVIKDTYIDVKSLRLWNLFDYSNSDYKSSVFNDFQNIPKLEDFTSYEDLCDACKTFSFNTISDTFYTIGSDEYTEDIVDLKIYYGQMGKGKVEYNNQSISKIEKNGFTLPDDNIDFTKDIYLKFVLTDVVGNSTSLEKLIQSSYFNPSDVYSNFGEYYFTHNYVTKIEKDIVCILCTIEEVNDKPITIISQSAFFDSENIYQTKGNNRIPYTIDDINSKKIFVIYKNVNNIDKQNTYFDIDDTNPYCSYYSVPTPISYYSTTNIKNEGMTIPEYKVDIQPGEKNSQRYYYDVTFTNPEQVNKNYTYFIEFATDSSSSGLRTTNFSSSDLHSYVNASIFYNNTVFYRLVAKDLTGNYNDGEYRQIVTPKISQETSAWDVFPPKCNINANISPYYIKFDDINDDETGIKTDEDNIPYGYIWFVPYDYNKWGDPQNNSIIKDENDIPDNNFKDKVKLPFTDEYLGNITYYTYYYYPYLPKGDYLILSKFEDNAGNYVFTNTSKMFYNRYTTDGITEYDLSDLTKIKYIFTEYVPKENEVDWSSGYYNCTQLRCYSFNTENSTWEEVEYKQNNEPPAHYFNQDQQEVYPKSETPDESGHKRWSLTDDLSKAISNDNTFYKIQFMYHFSSSTGSAFYTSNSCYYYNTEESTECNTKSISHIADSTYVVACDKPCLVQVVCAEKKYSQDKLTEMEKDGYIFGTKQFGESMIDFYTVDIDSVPEGLYYSVVAHFADGTAKMTEPVLK